MPSPQKPIALPRSSGLNDSSNTACEIGCSPPPHAPCATRQTTRNGRLGASPHRKEETVKPVTESISIRLRPKKFDSQPVSGRMMALDTRYEVSVQVASSIVADKLPAMCGSETLTTVVSSTSMKVLSMTATATIQGLTAGCAGCAGGTGSSGIL